MKKNQHYFSIFTILFLFINTFSNQILAQPACLGEKGKLKWLLWENTRGSRLDDLTHSQQFPNNPDAQEHILAISSPGIVSQVTVEENTFFGVQYASYYGSMIRVYISVPQTGNYTFNITGDDECKFFLSTDDTKMNLVLRAFVSEWTYREEYAKASESNQTSPNITLQAGQYYYFEVLQKEHGGGDHVEVKWKTPLDQANWQPITGDNIYDYVCALDCAEVGTACDDGNANTINDKEDGFCNCIGTPTTLPDCVGNQGEIRALYYLDIPGNSMSSLLEADKYPLMPDTVELLNQMVGPLVRRDTYGVKISGMLKVPVTGAYQFNVTSDDRAAFRLSTTTNPDDMVEVSYSNWSSTYDHYRYDYQLSDPILLNKDDFYYFEMNFREGTGTDRYAAYWRTPFMGDTLWRPINQAYIYGYDCELACVPEGTPCDDGNNFTKNDKYNSTCECEGTPCQGADCDETLASDYTPNEACGVSEKMDNSAANAWESCSPSLNPNAIRGISHWIQYDFKQVYLLNETHIWNYNASGDIGKGFKDVVIDYSIDGITWTQLGDISQWEQATGTVGYNGFEGPNFDGITARYVLITALNTWGNGVCSGFNKITFAATDCLLMGQTCDDGDPNSVNDKYDINCNCIGEGEGFVEQNLCEDQITQNNIILTPKEYRAMDKIVSEGIVRTGSDVTFMAGESIQLMDGFRVEAGADFIAMIEDCTQNPISEKSEIDNVSRIALAKEITIQTEKESLEKRSSRIGEIDLGITNLKVWPNPSKSWTSFTFNLPYNSIASLCIYDTDGKQVSCLATNQNLGKGNYTKEFPAQQLSAGMYYVVLKTEKEILTEPLVVIE